MATVLPLTALVCSLVATPPVVQPDAVRVASDGAAYDVAASCVSVHQGRVAFGVRGRDDGGVNRGAVYVHALSGGSWSQVQKLTPAAPVDREEFGTSVSLRGPWLAVGAPLADREGTDAGSAWIFDSNGVNFTQVQRLVPPAPQPGALFGCSIALDGSGSARIAIGARREAVNGVQAGAVHIFRREGSTWVHEGRVVAPGVVTEGDDFGQSIALHGNTLAVGTPNEDVTEVNAGGVHVFQLQGSAWVHEALVLPPNPEPLGEFGNAVTLQDTVLAIGAYREDGGGADAGRVHVFSRGAAGWGFTQSLQAPAPTAGAEFGSSLAIDGDALLVGAARATLGSIQHSGGAYLFRTGPAGWAPLATLGQTSAQSSEFMGASVGVSGLVVAVGAPLRSQSSPHQGAVSVVNLSADCDGDLIPDRVALAAGAQDCNGNGVPDSCDIAQGEPDDDGNGVPDSCEVVPCLGDLNDSGTVNAVDLALLIASWSDEPGSSSADIDGNGAINGADLGILLSAWGTCP